MVDFQLYGMNPAGHHLTSLLLHLANSILLFLLLQRMTKAMWPSALAAALFALHPLHVESVAWISERKDVLSTLFWMLSVGAYVRYVENLKSQISNFKFFYIGSVVLFALGLMAKPMLVTLPFILLLLDYWPLQRLQAARCPVAGGKDSVVHSGRRVVRRDLFRGAACGGAMESLAGLPLASPSGEHSRRYTCATLKKLSGPPIWPCFIRYRANGRFGKLPRSTALLALITGMGPVADARATLFAVGWFWFLGMLAPVIGLVQVGSFSMADRYDYLSSIGLFIMMIWAAREWFSAGRAGSGVAGGLAVAGCLAATAIQVRYWKDSETLFRHALAVTEHNGAMENDLGKVLFQEGRVDEALPHLRRAVAFAPNYPQSHFNLGNALLARGKVAEALGQFEIHAALQPGDPIAQYIFGSALLDQGLAGDAMSHLEKAVQLRPDAADFHLKLGDACRQTGRAAEAISQYEKALQILPRYVQAASSLAWMLATTPDASLRNGARAVQLALLADQLSGGQDPKIIGILAAAYAETGDFSKAAATVQHALQLAGPESDSALAGILRAQLALYRAGSPFRDTVKGN